MANLPIQAWRQRQVICCIFVIKNHPFADGNKRSGAFLFVDFLYKNDRLFNAKGEPIINDTGLTALALLIAESAPEQKETLIKTYYAYATKQSFIVK